MNVLARLLGIVRPYRWWMLLSALLGFATIGSGIGLLMSSAYIIAKAALHPSFYELQLGVTGVRLFGIARGALRYAERLVSHNTTFRILSRLRLWFYESLEPLAPARLQQHKSGDLLQRITGDIDKLENLYVRVVAPPLTAAMISLLLWFLLGAFSLSFSLALLCAHLLAGLVLPFLAGHLNRGTAAGISGMQSALQTATIDYIQGMGELMLFGRLEEERKKLGSLKDGLLRLQRKQKLIQQWHEALTGLLMSSAVLAVTLIMAPMISSGTLDGMFAAVIVVAVMASFEAFIPLPDTILHIEESSLAGKRLFEIIDTKQENAAAERTPRPFPEKGDIRFENVSFTYPGNATASLRGITFCIGAREKIAVVGPSGAGKSTIANLLLGFWPPSEGSVSIGGCDIRQLDQETLRRKTATVSQNTYLFGETLRKNLLLAKPEASDEELKAALRFAGLEMFAGKLDEWAGQHGMRFSGGERQRLAIARMALQDAPFVILDEATANLDAITEQTVMDSVREYARDRTLMVITHRLRNMERFDRIIVLDKGIAREEGTHRELIAKKGLYASMWSLQHRTLTKDLTGEDC
ncbi:thiol reductant ABC exporter subunit CydC [Prosthecochloris sp. GSB1]|uniref:thiol reductant ABC exporter subunit CydC n=1 Tax=Prosthecochloris sp. GSB1 TaxID=281093 RepID=UPI000B8C7328|nr:thiol reductant ABC exporter subunit CydC [Prosthecochloris sp. GSB1]ASQ90887.1 thiol reductant ABC exporter subunit CydC [Prosthecochloris sp. GSB1]